MGLGKLFGIGQKTKTDQQMAADLAANTDSYVIAASEIPNLERSSWYSLFARVEKTCTQPGTDRAALAPFAFNTQGLDVFLTTTVGNPDERELVTAAAGKRADTVMRLSIDTDIKSIAGFVFYEENKGSRNFHLSLRGVTIEQDGTVGAHLSKAELIDSLVQTDRVATAHNQEKRDAAIKAETSKHTF